MLRGEATAKDKRSEWRGPETEKQYSLSSLVCVLYLPGQMTYIVLAEERKYDVTPRSRHASVALVEAKCALMILGHRGVGALISSQEFLEDLDVNEWHRLMDCPKAGMYPGSIGSLVRTAGQC